jgi:very-short-patch-repair endonuclease
VVHNKLSQEAKWMAAVLAAGEGAVLSHHAAARHWNIWRRRSTRIDVTVPGQRRPRQGFAIHRARTLDARDITTHQGIPVTTVPRTLVDLAATLTPHQLANVIHEAAYRKRFNATATQQAMARAQGRDLTNLHAALHAHASGSAGTRSALEDEFLQRATSKPVVNTKLHGIEVDFHWPGARLVVEADGLRVHDTAYARRRDRQKQARLEEHGLRVLRVSWEQLTTEPGRTAARIRRALE